jgi:hypothetical protein
VIGDVTREEYVGGSASSKQTLTLVASSRPTPRPSSSRPPACSTTWESSGREPPRTSGQKSRRTCSPASGFATATSSPRSWRATSICR